MIPRYLRMPKDIPEYRKSRTHEDFVTNVSREAAAIKKALKDVWNVQNVQSQINQTQKLSLQNLIDTKPIFVEITP